MSALAQPVVSALVADGDEDSPAHCWLSNLPEEISMKALVGTVMSRWQIERDYQELKQGLGRVIARKLRRCPCSGESLRET